jgi:hypothetical protein
VSGFDKHHLPFSLPLPIFNSRGLLFSFGLRVSAPYAVPNITIEPLGALMRSPSRVGGLLCQPVFRVIRYSQLMLVIRATQLFSFGLHRGVGPVVNYGDAVLIALCADVWITIG